MGAYQEQAIAEKKELDERATKLSDFIGLSPQFEKIDPEDEKVVISKNREGERGVGLNLRMNGQYQRFEEYN